MRVAAVTLLLFFLVSCTQSESDRAGWSYQAMQPNQKELKIPRAVQKRIEAAFVRNYRSTQNAQLSSDDEILAKVAKSYLEVDVSFEAIAKGTLRANTQFQSTRGGGKIDLDALIDQTKGSFFARFQVEDPEGKRADLQNYDLFYWSTEPSAQIDGDKFGTGCGTLLKLQPSAFRGRGFQLNATDRRYAPVIHGTYYFANYEGPRLMLAVVQIGPDHEKSMCFETLAAR